MQMQGGLERVWKRRGRMGRDAMIYTLSKNEQELSAGSKKNFKTSVHGILNLLLLKNWQNLSHLTRFWVQLVKYCSLEVSMAAFCFLSTILLRWGILRRRNSFGKNMMSPARWTAGTLNNEKVFVSSDLRLHNFSSGHQCNGWLVPQWMSWISYRDLSHIHVSFLHRSTLRLSRNLPSPHLDYVTNPKTICYRRLQLHNYVMRIKHSWLPQESWID